MVVFGVEDTMKALELGALDTLMLFEDLQINRYVLKNPVKGDTQVILLNPKQEQNEKNFKDQMTGIVYEVQECEPLTGMVVFGVEDTMKALDLGALDTLMLFEEL